MGQNCGQNARLAEEMGQAKDQASSLPGLGRGTHPWMQRPVNFSNTFQPAATPFLSPPSTRVSWGSYSRAWWRFQHIDQVVLPCSPLLTCDLPSLRLSSQSALLYLHGVCLRSLFGGTTTAVVFKCGLAMHPKLHWGPGSKQSSDLSFSSIGAIVIPSRSAF